jgi:exopolysaccharide/PEP-CTERM locus tyrosine autokinase
VGKIFNALEKYKKERKASGRPGRLKQGDYEALLQYDWATGKLDLKHPLVNQDPGTIDRLLTYRLIEADGSLTPAGKAKYAELNGPESQSTLSEPTPEPAPAWQEIQTAVDQTDLQVPLRPVVREKLKPSDWDILMQYNRATKKLDVKSQDADVVRRLLGNDMIFDNGGLTPQALQLCKELEPEKILVTDSVINDTGEIAEIASRPVEEPLPVDDRAKEVEEPKTAATEAVGTQTGAETTPTTKKVEPKPARVIGKSPAAQTRAPKPDLPASHKEKMDQSLVSLFNPHSFEAEQFKILRSNLLYPVSGSPPRSVMVTSPVPGEGKSFVAANLAISVALNINRHVLLMDCDLRRPTIHTRFGFENVPGLSDYLSSQVLLSDLLLRTPVDKLSILPGGEPPDNPSELLSSERMSELLKEATERYQDRLIILDSPPPALTAETSVLARWVDGVVIVIKHNKTPRESVSDVIDKMGKNKIIGAVINNFEVYSSRYSKKYYGPGYGKGYKK